MYYKEYGNLGIKVSAVGFGGMRFDDGDIKADRLEQCAEIPLYAYEKGVNYFDSAPFYCDDKSESVMGIAISQMKRDKIFVSTKTNFGTVEKPHDRDAFFRRLEKSLERLRTSYIDFYHMWCILSLQGFEKQYETFYRCFEEAKGQGLIKNIVFSSHMQGDDLTKVIDTGKFKGMLIGYNALNYRFRQTGIASAYDKKMGIVVMNPLGGGVIPQNPDRFSYLTEGTDLTVPQAAARFVASHREITVTLVGMGTKEHVDDAVKAVDGLQERPIGEILGLYESKGSSFDNLCTGCGYCDECPAGISVPKFMDAYNQKLLGSSIKERLLYHWGQKPEDAGNCTGCGNCEGLCTQHLPIIERLGEIKAL